MRILSIDPGATTGFCLYDSEANKRIVEVWNDDLQPSPRHDMLWLRLETLDFDEIICEKFEFRKDDQARDKIDYLPAELVGVVKLYAYQNPHIKLTMQGSSLIGSSAFWSDDNKKVKQLGLYNSKAAPHGMDSLRHVLYYVSFTLNDQHFIQGLR